MGVGVTVGVAELAEPVALEPFVRGEEPYGEALGASP
jgi:hypothetical protein